MGLEFNGDRYGYEEQPHASDKVDAFLIDNEEDRELLRKFHNRSLLPRGSQSVKPSAPKISDSVTKWWVLQKSEAHRN